MKHFLIGVALVCGFVGSFNSSYAAGGPEVRKSLIVSTAWLSEHLKDRSLVLLQVGE